NNAGITRDSTMRRLDREMWQAVIDTNLGSCFNVSKAVWEGMNTRGFGRIVNVGSINGQGGQYGQVNYAAAKSGIHGFTKALAQEGAGRGITVNAVAPGYVDTEMVRAVPKDVLEKIVARIPVGRLGKAEDISARCCSWWPTTPISSPARRCRSMAASTCIEPSHRGAAMPDELVFYTNPQSRGRIVRWMLEEVGQPYRTELLDYATTMKAPAYLAVNPMGKVPALRHGETVITEAAAIC